MIYAWEGTVDDGAWHVGVVRAENPYVGFLEVRQGFGGDVVHREKVAISYGAPFGADSTDVVYWQTLATNVIDHPENRVIGA